MTEKRVELLAPAGGMRQLVAAVENGADAVYLGGSAFNARINADNFTDESLKEAIEYAHIRNVRVYVTMNTLYKDEEMEKAVYYAGTCYEAGADALIVQDLGFGNLIHEIYPDFELHLSTQATVYNRRGVAKASEMGYARVVPARELSIDEIREVSSGDTEIEVFIHGAMCICYSGQCQMSRVLGGRSGNRGMCAQPCRLGYRAGEKEGYLLSPKDMCQLNNIAELIEAGVASFKIEGRMKSPEYVAITVSIYRKYIDMYYEKGYIDVASEDYESLVQIFSRNGFTDGYLHGYRGAKMMSGDIPKHSGIYIGKTITEPDSYGVLDVLLEGELKKGDGVEIRGRKNSGNIITYIKDKGRNVYSIGDIKDAVPKGSRVYRTSRIDQLDKARASFEEGRFNRKAAVNFMLKASEGQIPSLEICEGSIREKVCGETICEKALKKPLDYDFARRQLSKLGGTPFELSELEVEIEGEPMLSASMINSMRRTACEALENRKKECQRKRKNCEISFEPAEISITGTYFYRKEDVLTENIRGEYAFICADDFLSGTFPEDIKCIPYIPAVTKGYMDSFIGGHMDELISRAEYGIMVENIAWIDELLNRGARLYGGPGLNVYNGYTDEFLRRTGLTACSYSLEATDERNGTRLLMITEYQPSVEVIIDRKGKNFDVVRKNDKTLILKKERDRDFYADKKGVRLVFV